MGFSGEEAVIRLDQAVRDGQLSSGAAQNIQRWLTEPRYSAYAGQITAHIKEEKWRQLDDLFWTVIPFGTGGRRGRMYPIGSNAINDRTIGESAQGLANYVKSQRDESSDLSCALAYDTRHRSRHFAELCAGIMVAAGFRVYLLDDYRSTPELSFLVRFKQCSCGIMVTASHNPPSDNAVKVYWSTGGQVLPPHDLAIIDQVMRVEEIAVADFGQSVANGKIVLCKDEVDTAFFQAVERQCFGGPRNLKLIYSPLHGVGASAVGPVLAAAGFHNVEMFAPHAELSGDFPNVPGHVANPENPRVFEVMVEHGRRTGADLVLATDPDCDRMGCAAPVTLDPVGPWATLDGNQLGALLTDYVLDCRRSSGNLTSDHYVVKTLVTTEMIRRIADSYGVRTIGDLPVGFKWIGGTVERVGAELFAFGCEESHGYMAGHYARDKDGVVACLLMAEMAAKLKSLGKSLHEKLDDLFWQHGLHAERLLTRKMEGSEGMSQMQELMAAFRESPPQQLGGIKLAAVRDYLNSCIIKEDQSSSLDGPVTNLIIMDLAEEGNYVAVRPSGTEPKIKFYLFAYTPPEQLADLNDAKRELQKRLDRMEQGIEKAKG
jgi:phosphomannomutase